MAIEEYSAGGCQGIELWMTSIEQYLQRGTLDAIKQAIDRCGVEVAAAAYHGGLLAKHDDQRAAAWEHFDRRLALCQQLQVPTLVVACDVVSPLTTSVVAAIPDRLHTAAEKAATCDVRLALEFQAASAFGNNLETAIALVERADHPHLGICLDLFHFMVGPSKERDLEHLPRERLFHVQLCDVAGEPRETVSDGARILPGEGDFPIEQLFAFLRQIEYDRWVSLEILNPRIWEIAPRQFGEIAFSSLRAASGG